jgi:signal transduction histidine kinase
LFKHLISLLTLLLVLCGQAAWADNQSLPSHAFVDVAGEYTIAEMLQQQPFSASTRIQQSFGITDSVIWLKIPLPDWLVTAQERHYIALNAFTNDRVDAFAVDNQQQIIAYWLAGDRVAVHTQTESFRQPTFPVTLETQALASHIYLRVSSKNAISFAVNLLPEAQWLYESQWAERINLLVMGFFAMAFIISLFNILMLKLYYYAWYALLLLSLSTVILSIGGWLPVYFPNAWFEHINVFGQFLVPLSLIYISHLLLKTQDFLPKIYRLKRWFIWLAGTFVLWSLLTENLSFGLKITHSLLMIIPFWILLESLWLIKRTPFAKSLALVIFLFVVIAFARIGMMNGFLEATLLALHGPTLFLWVISILIYFSMSYAIKSEREEKIKAETQAQLAQTQAEQRRLFLTMMAHELNTPLAVMNATLDNLAFRLPQDERTQARVDKLNKTIVQMNEVIDTCLLNERLQHESCVKLSPVLLDDWLNESMKQLMLIQDTERVQLPEQMPRILCHLNLPLMKIALVNLLDNALKYSPKDCPVHVSLDVFASQICLHIQDHGAGFGQAVLANTAGERKNMGLGLGMSDKIIALNGGKLHCDNTEIGAKASICLPCRLN